MTQIQLRRGTAAQWTAANPVLAAGEVGVETDTVRFKIGTGSTAWETLPYVENVGGAAVGDTVVQASTSSAFPGTGSADKLYVAKDTGDVYRWTGSAYQRISERVAASGVTDSTSIGRSLMTAASTSAARTAISAAQTRAGWYDVRDYGAVGNGTTDDTAAIQAAIDATVATKGGTVFFPPGRFKLTSALDLGTFSRNFLTLQGSGAGDMFGANDLSGTTTLVQTSTTADGLSCYGTLGLTINDLRVAGPKSGSGIGVRLSGYGAASFNVQMSNVLVEYFGGTGIIINSGPCVSSFRNVLSMHNLGHGWEVNGTSNSFISCWGGGNKNHGWKISSAYSTWIGCASDGNGLDGWFFGPSNQAINLSGCGAEYNNRDAFHCESYPEYQFLIGFRNCSAIGNRHHGWDIRGRSTAVTIEDCWENAVITYPIVSATANGTTVAVTAQKHLSTIAVGDKITLDGMTPSGFNGTWTVTAVSPDTGVYTLGCTVAGPITTAGNITHWKTVLSATGTGSVVTITVPGDVHWVPGDKIFMDGVNPSAYNGEHTVSAVSKSGVNTTISCSSTATGTTVGTTGYVRAYTNSVVTAAPAITTTRQIYGNSPASYAGYRDTVWGLDSNQFPTLMRGDGGTNRVYSFPESGGILALENLRVNAQTGTSYTLALADAASVVTLSNSSAITATVPTNASVAFPIGTRIRLSQIGSGQVTITPDSGVTVNSAAGLKTSAQYAVAELVKTGTNTWLASGGLTT